MIQPIDLSLLFSRRDARSPDVVPATELAGSAADRIAMPLDLRSAMAPASRRVGPVLETDRVPARPS